MRVLTHTGAPRKPPYSAKPLATLSSDLSSLAPIPAPRPDCAAAAAVTRSDSDPSRQRRPWLQQYPRLPYLRQATGWRQSYQAGNPLRLAQMKPAGVQHQGPRQMAGVSYRVL